MPSPLGVRTRRGAQDLAATVAVAVFDPTTLALSGYWRAPMAVPQTPTASTGTSGANGNLTNGGVSPSLVNSLNSKTVATFTGTESYTNANLVDATFLTLTGGWSGWALVFASAAGAPSVGSAYNEAALWSDNTQGYQQLTYSTRGWTLSRYDGSGSGLWREATVACATGGWHLVQFGWDGTNLFIQLDSAAVVTGATATTPLISSGPGTTLSVGKNFNGSVFFSGQLAELAFATTNLGATARGNVKSYVNSTYALAL